MQFPSFAFSEQEHSANAPLSSSLDIAEGLFKTHGSLRLENVFSKEFMTEVQRSYVSRYRAELAGTTKEDRRPLFSPTITGPLAEPYFYNNPLLFPLIQRLLGEDCVLGACGSVVSFPGSPQQFIHRDSASLYSNFELDVRLPSYALTVLIPLVDANQETGSTRVWPGSHRQPSFDLGVAMDSESPDVNVGSVLMTDSRTLHAGSPNRSQRVRPILYNSYHRSWYRDRGGYEERPAVYVTPGTLLRLNEEQRKFFRIARESSMFDRAQAKLKRVAARVLPSRSRAERAAGIK